MAQWRRAKRKEESYILDQATPRRGFLGGGANGETKKYFFPDRHQTSRKKKSRCKHEAFETRSALLLRSAKKGNQERRNCMDSFGEFFAYGMAGERPHRSRKRAFKDFGGVRVGKFFFLPSHGSCDSRNFMQKNMAFISRVYTKLL
jgi:hypothetical protein